MSIYRKEDIRKQLNESKKNYEAKIKEWEKVERVKTKDGKDFKVLGKNFKNARIINDWHYNIAVCGDSIGITIKNWQLADNDPRKVQGITYAIQHLDIVFTPDEIEAKIKDTIQDYKNNVKKYEEQLQNLDRVFEEVDKVVKELKGYLSEKKEEFGQTVGEYRYPNSLHYALKEYIKTAL